MTWPFENDTSAVEKKLATRSMKADKRRSIFVIITIALAVCLMGTLCFVYSSEQLQTLEHIQGQYQAGCSASLRKTDMNGCCPGHTGSCVMHVLLFIFDVRMRWRMQSR